MGKFLNKKLFIVAFILIIVCIFERNVYAEGAEDGKDEGATGTYAENIQPQITRYMSQGNIHVTYEIKANSSRPIYQFDEINLKIHRKRDFNSGDMKLDTKDGYDEKQMQLEVVDFKTETHYINEADISLKMRPLTNGDITCKMTIKDNSVTTITVKVIGILPFSDKFETDARDMWGANYHEAKVFSIGMSNPKDAKVAGIILGQYSGTNYDTSNTDNPGEQVYSYTVKKDTGWQKYAPENLETGITYKEMEVETIAIIDYGREIHKGEKYKCLYMFYFIPDKNKLIYRYSRERIETSAGEAATDITGQESTEKFKDLTEQDEEQRKKYFVFWEDTEEERNSVIFVDVLTNTSNYIPTDEASDGRLESKVSVILTVITNIGMILAVLMVAIIGVKYMLGSVEEKAEYKKDMIPYLVGAFLLFGITVIVKVLQQIGQSINNI